MYEAEPGSSAHGIVASDGQNVERNVVEGISSSGGGSATGITAAGSSSVSGNVVISGNVVSGVRSGSGGSAHGIVIGGQPQEGPQRSEQHVRHSIIVPEGRKMQYDLVVTAGIIQTQSAQGSLKSTNTTGKTVIKNHRGPITAHSTTGAIDILNYLAGAVVTLQTITGHINSPLVNATQGRRRGALRAIKRISNQQIGDGTYRVNAETVTGNISFTYSGE